MAYIFDVDAIKRSLKDLVDLENNGQKANKDTVLELMLRVAFLPNRQEFEEKDIVMGLLNDNFCDRIQNRNFCMEFLHQCEGIIYELRRENEAFSSVRNRIVYLFMNKSTVVLGLREYVKYAQVSIR